MLIAIFFKKILSSTDFAVLQSTDNFRMRPLVMSIALILILLVSVVAAQLILFYSDVSVVIKVRSFTALTRSLLSRRELTQQVFQPNEQTKSEQ